ncbi:MAG TPA: DUF429 domain-containing protein, partial [Phycisphaerales bacterium]|nr:DUF429 domain-containing protein [Phycisphaerales bacterium]
LREVAGGDDRGDAEIMEVREILLARDFQEALERTAECRRVCVHIPIGLGDGPARGCDVMARRLLGRPRAGSVFDPPIRGVLEVADYPTATRENFAVSLRGLNMRTFRMMDKIRQVDAVMTAERQGRLREAHPELAFHALNGGRAVNPGKKSPAGRALRRRLLRRVFADFGGPMPRLSLRTAEQDDVHDAMAVCWTAYQCLAGRCSVIPPEPQLDARGLRMELLIPSRRKDTELQGYRTE